MTTPVATYTLENCKAAFQLNWALSLFWRAPPSNCDWLAELQQATETDGVRILKHDFLKPGVSQFLLRSASLTTAGAWKSGLSRCPACGR